MTKSVGLSCSGGVATITLSGAASANGIDDSVSQELSDAAETVGADEDVVVVLLRSRGGNFCCGGGTAGADWARSLAAIPQPLIAAIQGDALEEGAELGLIADIRVCGQGSRFRFGHLAEDRIPTHGATQRLPRSVGRMRALEILMSGRWVGAAEAVRIGLVTEVVPAGRLANRSREVARDLAKKGPIALRYAKEAVLEGLNMTLDQGVRLEQDLYVLLQTTEDRAEGVRSFLDKRSPRYRGK